MNDISFSIVIAARGRVALLEDLMKSVVTARTNYSMWRYRELLPVEDSTPDTPLRVGWSPLYEEKRLAEELGIGCLWVKDDGLNPTASLKDRASAMAVAKASEAGASVIAVGVFSVHEKDHRPDQGLGKPPGPLREPIANSHLFAIGFVFNLNRTIIFHIDC